MDTRLWKFIGTSRRTDGVKTPGLVKFRFSNFPSRKKALEKTGNAEVTMFEDIKYPATTEAMIDCEVLMINKKAFMENFFGNVNLLQSIIKSLSMKVTYLMNSLEVETSIGTDLKIAKFIINHEETIGNIKHKDIAYELNTTSETVSRILKKFAESELLSKTNPIIIKNLHGLKVLCN